MVEINPIERALLSVLLRYRTFKNTTFIAGKAQMSWNTAEKYLNRMEAKGWVTKKGIKRSYWKAKIKVKGTQ